MLKLTPKLAPNFAQQMSLKLPKNWSAMFRNVAQNWQPILHRSGPKFGGLKTACPKLGPHGAQNVAPNMMQGRLLKFGSNWWPPQKCYQQDRSPHTSPSQWALHAPAVPLQAPSTFAQARTRKRPARQRSWLEAFSQAGTWTQLRTGEISNKVVVTERTAIMLYTR